MSKKNRKEKRPVFADVTSKELQDVCLHCAFFEMHKTKWPDWRPDKPEADDAKHEAFNDLIRSVRKIVTEALTMLSPHDQMMFWRQTLDGVRRLQMGGDDRPESIAEVIEMFKAAMSVKH